MDRSAHGGPLGRVPHQPAISGVITCRIEKAYTYLSTAYMWQIEDYRHQRRNVAKKSAWHHDMQACSRALSRTQCVWPIFTCSPGSRLLHSWQSLACMEHLRICKITHSLWVYTSIDGNSTDGWAAQARFHTVRWRRFLAIVLLLDRQVFVNEYSFNFGQHHASTSKSCTLAHLLPLDKWVMVLSSNSLASIPEDILDPPR